MDCISVPVLHHPQRYIVLKLVRFELVISFGILVHVEVRLLGSRRRTTLVSLSFCGSTLIYFCSMCSVLIGNLSACGVAGLYDQHSPRDRRAVSFPQARDGHG